MFEKIAVAGALIAAFAASPLRAQEAGAHQPVPPAAAAPESQRAWWTSLNDPVLTALIEQGLDANLDIAQAHARIQRSRALLAGARADFGPGGSVGLQGRAAQASETQAPGLARADRRDHHVQAGIDFSWEVDLFGRLDHRAAAASQRLHAKQAHWHGVRLAISAEIADAYFALVGAREQLELSRTVATNRERTLKLVSARTAGGAAAPIDEIRARADLQAAQAQVPLHETAARIASHRIAVLTDRSPSGFDLPTAGSVQPAAIAIRIPAAETWLASRPDLQAQEAELRALALDIRAIRAEFYPRLTISGVLGFVAGSVGSLGAGGSVSWLSAPALLAPLFDRPRIEARLAAATAEQKEALAAYRQRILLATEEVENALARYTLGQQQFQALQRRAELAVQAERLSRVRYEAGASDLLELLDTQRSAQQAQAELATALSAQRQHLVAVFKGMGGGA